MNSQEIKALTGQYILNTYAGARWPWTTGRARHALRSEGKAYIDFASGIGVPAWATATDDGVKAVADQAGKLGHSSNLFYTDPPPNWPDLCQRTGSAGLFFATARRANEGLIKLPGSTA
jgi:acetylornithine/N-succinyldiaminopimelate aminotransferase